MQKKDFKIESKIYGEKIIKKAVKDFAVFNIQYKNGILSISQESIEYIEEIFNEFMNYTIGLSNETI